MTRGGPLQRQAEGESFETLALKGSAHRSDKLLGTSDRLTEVARLAIREVELAVDSENLMQSARQILEGANTFPRPVFVFVHGYNVSFENALRRMAQIAYDLNFDGASFLFSWPSRSSLWSYTSDRESAEIAVNHLKEFLERVIVEAQATKVHFIAHSMGNVVLLGALEKIALSSDPNLRLRLSEIVLHWTSPDLLESHFLRPVVGLEVCLECCGLL